MPRRKKTDILNYKIYKIASLDPNITEIYVGSTADLKQRKGTHKKCCNNENDNNYHLKVYQYIRANGGFDNFKFYVVEELECNEYQAELREEYYRKELNATLNMKMCCNFDGTTQEYQKEYQKEYREIKKEQIREQKKEYYENKKEHLKQYQINNNFTINRNRTIRDLKKGVDVKDVTLQKYNINRAEILEGI